MLGCSLKAVKSFVAPAKQFAVVAVVGVINLKLAHTARKARDTENIITPTASKPSIIPLKPKISTTTIYMNYTARKARDSKKQKRNQ